MLLLSSKVFVLLAACIKKEKGVWQEEKMKGYKPISVLPDTNFFCPLAPQFFNIYIHIALNKAEFWKSATSGNTSQFFFFYMT